MTGAKIRTPSRTTTPHPAGVSTKSRRLSDDENKLYKFPRYVSVAFGFVIMAVSIQYFYNKYIYLPGRISTKSDLPLVGENLPADIWGTYRSHVYFGLRTLHPESPLFGLMWYEQPPPNSHMVPLVRHWCDQSDSIVNYGWTEADGRSFGKQNVQEKSFKLKTDWINRKGAWRARVTVTSNGEVPSNIALIFYFVIQEDGSVMTPIYKNEELDSIVGKSKFLGQYQLRFDIKDKNYSKSFVAGEKEDFLGVTKLKEFLISATVIERKSQQMRLPSGYAENAFKKKPVVVFLQINVLTDSTTDIIFSTETSSAISGNDFDKTLGDRVENFNKHFEEAYELKAKGYASFYQHIGRVALSNMLGSIGFSHGYNHVLSKFSNSQSFYGPHSLLTTCPCRSTFPRGFLWDEGFHHLLFRRFDPSLSLQILSSWLDTMNIEGWIPREMILGEEAKERVPAEFVIQRDTVANPPMIFLLIERFIADSDFMAIHAAELVKLYPRLQTWYSWLNSTQVGPLPGTYRWHGRNSTTTEELNPKTLPSGLDDYPRASHPSDDEYHLDLRCWMAMSSRVLSQLARLAGDWDKETLYAADASYLSDMELLNKLHWSREDERYCDFGLHCSSVELRAEQVELKKNNVKNNLNNIAPILKRHMNEKPVKKLVNDAFGYVSLFPVMLMLIPHDSPNLELVLKHMRSDKELWSEFGLRSLSPSSPYYKAYNTAHDPPYWRGAVWININYLMLSALKHYSSISGPYQELAFSIYSELRNNVVTNVAREFKRTGYLWENYRDEDGFGQGAHPFTGWSSLVLAIMAELYS